MTTLSERTGQIATKELQLKWLGEAIVLGRLSETSHQTTRQPHPNEPQWHAIDVHHAFPLGY